MIICRLASQSKAASDPQATAGRRWSVCLGGLFALAFKRCMNKNGENGENGPHHVEYHVSSNNTQIVAQPLEGNVEGTHVIIYGIYIIIYGSIMDGRGLCRPSKLAFAPDCSRHAHTYSGNSEYGIQSNLHVVYLDFQISTRRTADMQIWPVTGWSKPRMLYLLIQGRQTTRLLSFCLHGTLTHGHNPDACRTASL